MIGGALVLIIGLVLAPVVLDNAASAGSSANIGSFSGAQALNDLAPVLYFSMLTVFGVGFIGLGAKVAHTAHKGS